MAQEIKATNITWHDHAITTEDREKKNGHRACVIWFTGLSGSGKSTVAQEVNANLFDRGCQAFVLDGDNVRHGLNKDLGFSPEDREENIRRIGEVAKLFCEAGVIAMTAFISPYKADRDKVRAIVGDKFVEVHVHAALEICEERDPKGLYKKARSGEIPEFTGISAPYEAPEHAEIFLDTGKHDLKECVAQVLSHLAAKGII
ncbi:MAG: adenylyl-sulfate kinase [Candidatus Hydrogenedentota bacterium]